MPEFAPYQLDSERKPGSIRYWSRRNEQAILAPPSVSSVLQHTGAAGTPVIWLPLTATGIDHGGLAGLADDDHTQYALLAGTLARNTFNYGTGASADHVLAAGPSTTTDGLNWGYGGASFGQGQSFINAHANTAGNAKLLLLVQGTTRLAIDNNGVATVTSVVDASTGYRIGGAAASGNYLRGNGTNFVANTIQSGDLPAVSREIPVTMFAQTLAAAAAVPTMPDEVATNLWALFFAVPSTWDGSTAITLKTLWFNDATGNKDIETEIVYGVETDETALTTVQAFTNSNLSWTAANVTKTLTTTITPAAGRYYRVRFRCNTGDASTGNLYFEGLSCRTAYQ